VRTNIDTTKQIVASAKPFSTAIQEHNIVGYHSHASFRRLKLI